MSQAKQPETKQVECDMKSPIKIHKRPRLRNPYLIIGWEDAGLVGINAIDYLTDKLGAEEFAEIEPHDFSLLPYIRIKGGVLQEIEYPKNSFYYWKNKKSTGDLILLGSRPPALHHHEMANLILDVAELFNVKRIYTVGGIHANIAHTGRPRVTAIINNPELKKYVTNYRVSLGRDYEGPTNMNGLILGNAKQRNIDGISLWGRVPSYIAEISNPRVSYAVLRILTTMLDIEIDFGEIEAEARQANQQIDELVSYIRTHSPDLDRYIKGLEKGIPTETSEEDRQQFFEEVEEFLRKEKDRREYD